MAAKDTGKDAKQRQEDKARMRQLIVTLGDQPAKLISAIKGCNGALQDDLDDYSEHILMTIVDCAMHLPTKSAILAILCGLINVRKPAFVQQLIDRTAKELQERVKQGKYMQAQLLLRFVICLANCQAVQATAALEVLVSLLKLIEGVPCQEGGDVIVGMVMGAVPWISTALREMHKSEVDIILDACDVYMARRNVPWLAGVTIFNTAEAAITQKDRLGALWHALKQLREKWEVISIVAPYVSVGEQLAKGVPHQLPPFILTTADVKKKSLVYMVDPIPVSPGGDEMTAVDRWVLQDLVIATIHCFSRSIGECRKQVLMIPVNHAQFDRVVIETIYGQMLRVPAPSQLPLFYFRLLQSTPTLQSSMKGHIEAVGNFYISRMGYIDVECGEVLADFLSFYLAASQYAWSWDELVGEAVAMPHAQRVARFMRQTMEQLQRLSFHDNLLSRLPKSLHEFVPPEPVGKAVFRNSGSKEYADLKSQVRIKDADVAAVKSVVMALVGALRTREVTKIDTEGDVKKEGSDDEDIMDVIEPVVTRWSREEVLEMFMYAVLENGSRTPTHCTRLLDWYKDVFPAIIPKDPTEAAACHALIMKSITAFWKLSGLRMQITTQAMVVRDILPAQAAIDHLFLAGSMDEDSHTDSLSCWHLVENLLEQGLREARMLREELAGATKMGNSERAVALQQQLEVLDAKTKQVFVSIFKGLFTVFAKTPTENFKRITLSRTLAVGRRYHEFLAPFLSDIEEAVSSPELAGSVQQVWTLLRAIAAA